MMECGRRGVGAISRLQLMDLFLVDDYILRLWTPKGGWNAPSKVSRAWRER